MTRTTVLLACLLAAPSLAHAQSLDDRSPRVGMNLALGLGGALATSIDAENAFFDARFETDLHPSVGLDLRGEIPVLDFLVVGAMFSFLGVAPAPGPRVAWDREETVSFDAYVRGRWVFEAVRGELFIEPYVMLPLGFTMAVLPDDDGSGDDVWPGWNTGALLGCQVIHGSGLGGYLELGWRHAEIYSGQRIVLTPVDVAHALNEFAMNLGVVYAFGG